MEVAGTYTIVRNRARYSQSTESSRVPRTHLCASKAHMTAKAAELERTIYIAVEILVNRYPEQIDAGHISSDCSARKM